MSIRIKRVSRSRRYPWRYRVSLERGISHEFLIEPRPTDPSLHREWSLLFSRCVRESLLWLEDFHR